MSGEGRAVVTVAFGKRETEAQGQGHKGVSGGGSKDRSHGPVPEPWRPLTPPPAPPSHSPCLRKKSKGRARGKEKPRRWTTGDQGRASPSLPTPLSASGGGGARLLLPPRRQCCYGDRRYLATELRGPGHLLPLLWLWGWTCVQKLPCLGKPTCGHKTGRPGQEGTSRAPPGSVSIRRRLSFFSRLGTIVLIYGITKITL